MVRPAREPRRPALLKQALAAIDRGNLEAGFWLLHEAIGVEPHDPRTILAFWDVAVASGRAEAASKAMGELIHRQAASGELSVAADHWIALMREVPHASLDPASLVRIVPELRSRMEQADGEEARKEARGWLVSAIRQGVDPHTEALSPGLALRLFEEARSLDPEAARQAAEVALQSPDLHERKRARVQELLRGLEGETAHGAPGPATISPGDVPPPRLQPPQTRLPSAPGPIPDETRASETAPEGGAELRSDDPSPKDDAPAPDLNVIEAMPLELGERGLLIRKVGSQRRVLVDYGVIEALAAALVQELATEAVLIIDLLLKGSRRGDTTRHVLRMRSDSFDPNELLPERTDPDEALRSFLAALFERCRAVPLPDPDSALGLRPPLFPTLEAYEHCVFEGLNR